MVECQHQVTDKAGKVKLFFCLLYKEYIRSCPSKCPDYKFGNPLSLDMIYQENFDIECVFFQQLVQCTPEDIQSFVCEITGGKPDCPQCPVKTDVWNETTTKD
ncbi:MAG: hypothetical protein ACXAC6_07170 [Candidatus Hodarchaeales archaeon]|jgi:hypothetical protein